MNGRQVGPLVLGAGVVVLLASLIGTSRDEPSVMSDEAPLHTGQIQTFAGLAPETDGPTGARVPGGGLVDIPEVPHSPTCGEPTPPPSLALCTLATNGDLIGGTSWRCRTPRGWDGEWIDGEYVRTPSVILDWAGPKPPAEECNAATPKNTYRCGWTCIGPMRSGKAGLFYWGAARQVRP